MLQRWAGTPDLAWAGVGAVLTALAAGWAAFSLGVPGRSPARRLGGCCRRRCCGSAPAAWDASAAGWRREPHVAIAGRGAGLPGFILTFSVPLSVLLVVLLRRAYPLRPVLTAVMIGLASAAASASLLEICHDFDAAATDLAMHALAVALGDRRQCTVRRTPAAAALIGASALVRRIACRVPVARGCADLSTRKR